MANTYSQIYIHFVFAVQNRDALILPTWEERLYQYITGIVQSQGQKMIAINGMPDHLHFLIGMKPDCRPSDLVRDVKKSSSSFIKQERFSKFHFEWQVGYGVFSYSHSHLDNIAQYIMNQKEHHKKKTFKQEYLGFLKKFEIEFKEEYAFSWIADA
ncbi:MAG: IS200/IS605 family transposase [Bacteroidetes bacterium]|nr:IS200/IS605 family transposase [Bacteroidota bacterium]